MKLLMQDIQIDIFALYIRRSFTWLVLLNGNHDELFKILEVNQMVFGIKFSKLWWPCCLILILILPACAGIFSGCKSSEPIQVVGVYNGPGFNTPGGPTITITLKNISTKPIVYLLATITPASDNPGGSFEFVFKVDSLNPLLPDTIISRTQILIGALIGGGFNTSDLYNLDMRGIFQGNGTFQFSQQVAVSEVDPIIRTG